MVFDIKYVETNVGWFEVEAENKEEAYNKFWDGVAAGEYDLLKTDTVYSEAAVFEKD